MKVKKKKKAKEIRENIHSWQQAGADKQLEIHTFNSSLNVIFYVYSSNHFSSSKCEHAKQIAIFKDQFLQLCNVLTIIFIHIFQVEGQHIGLPEHLTSPVCWQTYISFLGWSSSVQTPPSVWTAGTHVT